MLDLESHPPPAGIDQVTLTLDVAPGRILQHSLLTRPLPTPDHLSTLVARLTALMGEGRCGQPLPLDTHRPGVVALAPFAPFAPFAPEAPKAQGPGPRGQGAVSLPRFADDGRVHASQGEPAALLRRFRRPLPARVIVGDQGEPLRLAPRQAGLPAGRVLRHAGPWRTSGEWWQERPGPGRRGGPWDRDEWDVALEDRAIYRVSRDRASGEWIVEGYWD